MPSEFSDDDCRLAAAIIDTRLHELPDKELAEICASRLRSLLGRWAFFCSGITHAATFVDESVATLQIIRARPAMQAGELHAYVFSLTECLTLLTREHECKGTEQDAGGRSDLLDYFERCGHWEKDDDTLVARYYYRLIPEAVDAEGRTQRAPAASGSSALR